MNFQHLLFDTENEYLPRPITGETLYSWCVRFHRISTNTNAGLTSRQLFNDSTAGFKHDFPTHLLSFSENTNQLLGPVERVIYDRTIFSIFAPFLSPTVIEDVVLNMQKGVHSRIEYHLGLRGSSISTVAPLKACPSCIHADKISSGTAWWHIEHQFPTVHICPIHGDYLLMATQAFHLREFKDWVFPTDIPPNGWNERIAPDLPTMTKLRNLMDWSLRLSKYYDRPFDSDLLRLTYHLRAKSLGLSSIDGTLKFKKLRLEFRNAYQCQENIPGFSFIRDTIHDHGGFLGSILLNIGPNKHPLRNLLLMEFLFDSPKAFIAEYEQVHSSSILLGKKELWTQLSDSKNQLKMLVTEADYPVNTAAQKLHIPLKQAKSFLNKERVQFKELHSGLDQNKENELKTFLMDGDAPEEIALKLEITKHSIICYLARDSELQNNWRQSSKKRIIENNRALFLQFLADNPNLSTTSIRRMPESGFQWLKTNDKDWLKQNLPGIWNKRVF